jgi:hypothetical protein
VNGPNLGSSLPHIGASMNIRAGVFLLLSLLAAVSGASADTAKVIRAPRKFPFVISKPGSYVLKGNVTVADANTTAFEITVPDVTLDLGGHTIQGPVVCSGSPTTCASTGTGHGISSSAPHTTVRNGTVRGMGDFGVLLNGVFDNVGMNKVEDVTAVSNGGTGIGVGGSAGSITRCRAFQNGNSGLSLSSGGHQVSENQASFNGQAGIFGGGQSLYERNVVRGNGAAGIDIGGSNMLVGNLVQGNVGFAFSDSGSSGYEENVLVGNNGGNANPQVDGGLQFGPNLCGNDTVCP